MKGFTLIEFIAVLVIMGVLVAIALPEFIEPETKAHQSAADAVAAGLTAASANNYAIRKSSTSNGSAVTNCTDVGSLPIDLLPPDYSITPTAISADAAITCTVTHTPSSTSANFVGLGIN